MSVNYQIILQAVRGPKLPLATNIVILALFSWWVVSYAMPMFEQKQEIAPVPVVNKEIETSAQPSLKNLDIFGTVDINKPIKDTSTAKPTKLNLTLRGILATDDPSQGIAQIQNASQEEKHFTVNDSVFGVATLEEIHIDRVILLHNGRYETLLLPEEFLNVKHFSVEKQIQERKETATDYRNIFLSGDGDDLMKLFGFDTAWKNGEFVGFIIKALGPKGIEMMEILGVKNGDVIVVVNGLRFTESLEAAEQLKDLKYATSVDVIIDRDGEEIPFHFDFDTPIADKIEVGAPGNDTPGSSDSVNNNFNSQSGDTNNSTNSTNDDTDNSSAGKPYKNKITEDGKVDRSGFTRSLIDSRDDDEDLEPDWDETPEGKEYRLKQLERKTGVAAPVETDH